MCIVDGLIEREQEEYGEARDTRQLPVLYFDLVSNPHVVLTFFLSVHCEF